MAQLFRIAYPTHSIPYFLPAFTACYKSLFIRKPYIKNTAIQIVMTVINHLKATGHVMHQQFNTQQLYVLPTLHLCVLCLYENKQRLVPLTA